MNQLISETCQLMILQAHMMQFYRCVYQTSPSELGYVYDYGDGDVCVLSDDNNCNSNVDYDDDNNDGNDDDDIEESRVLVRVFCLRSEQPHSPHSAPSFAWSRCR